MKHLKYLNAVLTVIATCLVLLTMAVLGVIPTASAKGPASAPIDVNIVKLNGSDLGSSGLPVNVVATDGRSIRSNPVPVVITR
jgi:hypothetical protein